MHNELYSINNGKGWNILNFLYKRGEGLKIYLAITKFKSLSTYYKFATWLIFLINFLGDDLSSISASKSYASRSPKSIGRLRPLSRDG